MHERVREHIRVTGVVQGVGFRPFVYTLAGELGLTGFVGNDVHGVFVEVEGPRSEVARFREALSGQAPPLAVVDEVTGTEIEPRGDETFEIALSDSSGKRATLVSADSATCADCLAELRDPADRRYRYPFLNCTNCGPRFTIVTDVPYDRPLTTMAPFGMCADCAAEYHDPANRRFHAQPVCCPACGPRLRLTDSAGTALPDDPLRRTAAALREGGIVAVKGLGGYHLAVDAANSDAAATLRKRKHREEKPFAIMVPDVARARELCEVDEHERALLESRRRPIVLLDRRGDARVAEAVAPGNRQLGVMLPYTPLHHLLLDETGPIVLTSANLSDEPIAYRDADARERLAEIADLFLGHDRGIHMRTDDSVVRSFEGRELPVRRSRGWVPEPVPLRTAPPRAVLACGAELKNTFCVAEGPRAFVSHHIGDLENYETLRSFTEGIEHFQRLFEIEPEVVAHDLHPEYLSTKYAVEREGVDLVGVQHHHAHIASCLADNGERGPALGVAFDGLGFGTDGTIWGGEFLLADLAEFQRLAHLETVPMPGGDRAVKQPWRMALAQLRSCCGAEPPLDLGALRRNESRVPAVLRMCEKGVNAPRTSSAGRLFDAVAAILGLRDTVSYEGQAAIELEQLADRAELGHYPVRLPEPVEVGTAGAAPMSVPSGQLVRAVLDQLRRGEETGVIAARFHNGVAELIARVCDRLRDATGVEVVALSGGVFQNMLLVRRTVDALRRHGFRVLLHSRVPPNDGGISLGQVAVAAERDRRGETSPA
ncbi:HAD family hydrolase [Actinopolyspora erythraea]|uniref:Carbamoyltransferase n=1 Tax=Actinopolyspora erythraea TaxID=414996 RepID=A0ABR4X232_9ACTN|nr:HAD family hydrolase [Actinopolyspora erythraea]